MRPSTESTLPPAAGKPFDPTPRPHRIDAILQVLADSDLTVVTGETIVVYGPSASGKSPPMGSAAAERPAAAFSCFSCS